MSRTLARYAEKLSEDLAYYQQIEGRPEAAHQRLINAVQYELIDTCFMVLEGIVRSGPEVKHGMSLVKDDEHENETLILANGAQVQRSFDCEADEGLDRLYSLVVPKVSQDDHTDLLIDELLVAVDDYLQDPSIEFQAGLQL